MRPASTSPAAKGSSGSVSSSRNVSKIVLPLIEHCGGAGRLCGCTPSTWCRGIPGRFSFVLMKLLMPPSSAANPSRAKFTNAETSNGAGALRHSLEAPLVLVAIAVEVVGQTVEACARCSRPGTVSPPPPGGRRARFAVSERMDGNQKEMPEQGTNHRMLGLHPGRIDEPQESVHQSRKVLRRYTNRSQSILLGILFGTAILTGQLTLAYRFRNKPGPIV